MLSSGVFTRSHRLYTCDLDPFTPSPPGLELQNRVFGLEKRGRKSREISKPTSTTSAHFRLVRKEPENVQLKLACYPNSFRTRRIHRIIHSFGDHSVLRRIIYHTSAFLVRLHVFLSSLLPRVVREASQSSSSPSSPRRRGDA